VLLHGSHRVAVYCQPRGANERRRVMRPRTLIAFFAFAIGIQLPNPGGAASLTTQEGASHPALDNDYRLGVALELPAAEAHRRQYEYLSARAVTMTSGDIPTGEMVVGGALGAL